MNARNVRKWVAAFKAGRQDVHDESRSGRPSVVDEECSHPLPALNALSPCFECSHPLPNISSIQYSINIHRFQLIMDLNSRFSLAGRDVDALISKKISRPEFSNY
ncbi:hypothetical protein M8J77_025834 [Diaphorina citri]|nr:hypothetical protein M8J77_025834 [Diaphorina citri]